MKKILLIASIFIGSLACAQEILTLDDCLQMGESNNPYIRNAQLDILSSKAMKSELIWEYFPTVSLNGIGYYAQNPLLRIKPKDILGTSDFAWELNNAYINFANENGLKTSYTTLKKGYGVAMMLTQPIYAGGRISNGNRLAAIGIEASRLQADMKTRDIQGRNNGQFNGIGFVSVKIPLTGIGKAAARARRMDYEIQKVSNEKEYLEEQLQLQKHQLFLAIETAADQAELSKSFKDDAETRMLRCEGNYKAGRTTLADLLQAELQYRTAAEQYIDDCIEYRKAVNTYKRRYTE